MRTTANLDPDTVRIIRTRMREHGVSLDEAVDEFIPKGVPSGAAKPFRTRTYPMGEPSVNLDKSLQIAAELEDDELI